MKKMLHNKRGQIGETLTWVVALAIITAMMILSIIITTLIVNSSGTLLGINLGVKNTGKTFQIQSPVDLFAQQSLLSYLATKGSSGNIIYEDLKSGGNFKSPSYSGNLAFKLFHIMYFTSYPSGIYLGVSDSPIKVSSKGNDYFNKVPNSAQSNVRYAINLNNGKYFDAIFAGGEK